MENVLFKISFPAEFHAQTAVEARDARCTAQVQGPAVATTSRRSRIRTHEAAIRIIDKKGPLEQPGRPRPLHPVHGRGAAALRPPDRRRLRGRRRRRPAHRRAARQDRLRRGQAVHARLPRPREALDRQRAHRRVQGRHEARRKSVVEYPIGHKRRRKEGMPLLEAKFKTNLARRFPPKQQKAILELCLDAKRLEATPVQRVRRPVRRSEQPGSQRASPSCPRRSGTIPARSRAATSTCRRCLRNARG